MKSINLILLNLTLSTSLVGCSANLGGLPNLPSAPANQTPATLPAQTAAPAKPAVSTPAVTTPASALPGLPLPSGGGLVDDVNANFYTNVTVVQGDINGELVVEGDDGSRSALHLPSDPQKAAAVRAAAQPGKRMLVNRNNGEVQIESQGRIFEYSLVEITDNRGDVSISSLR